MNWCDAGIHKYKKTTEIIKGRYCTSYYTTKTCTKCFKVVKKATNDLRYDDFDFF